MVKLVKFIAFMLVFTCITAISAESTSDEVFFEDLKDLAEKYSNDLDTIPFSSNIASNERINLYIGTETGELNIFIVVFNGKITNFEKGMLNDATLNIYTTKSTILEIMDSENPISSTKEALKQGKIKMEGVGFIKSLEIAIITFLMNFF
ncbi:conserved hypothetical protein [Methanococcus vannielii SB]|uniref:SCP2 domain-containing protein n=1 Tax=Methanococcus vannielii (strain ATCC 35089 / DSM 1224 / JCM 13029 / OCM 148 / SB) TaxID=406327 RepID=A6URU9_METVS|nr:hypothetical protein [Methanococcus vannielii]ABR55221.1 conserved hypothetical protein [Methanococcus vannielii SB]